MNRAAERKAMFKKGVDAEHGRRRREETTTQIRKNKKEEQLLKRRQAPGAAGASSGDVNKLSENKEIKKEIPQITDIPGFMDVLRQPGAPEQQTIEAVVGIRRMLSVEVNPPVKEVLEAGALPFLVSLLDKKYSPTIIFEASWALTNIASTEMTRVVVDAGALYPLIAHLRNHGPDVREQAAWCIGNIAGDCTEFRDMILESSGLDGLILNINEPASMTLLNNVTWAVSNLCRGKPAPRRELIEPAIAPLAGLFHRDANQDVLVDALWALSYLADGNDDSIQAVLNAGVAPILVEILKQDTLPMLTPAVRTLGNLVTGTDEQTQKVLDAGILDHIMKLISHPNKSIRKEACWLISNVAAGTKDQINLLFQRQNLLDRVVNMAQEERFEIRKEALWVVANIFTTGSDSHVRQLVQKDGLCAMTRALEFADVGVLHMALEAIECTLDVGAKLGLNYNQIFDEFEGIDKLESLQQHQSDAIYEKAIEIMEKFFGVEEEEDENVAPQTENGKYAFGFQRKQLFPPETDEQQTGAAVFGASSRFNFSPDMNMQH